MLTRPGAGRPCRRHSCRRRSCRVTLPASPLPASLFRRHSCRHGVYPPVPFARLASGGVAIIATGCAFAGLGAVLKPPRNLVPSPSAFPDPAVSPSLVASAEVVSVAVVSVDVVVVGARLLDRLARRFQCLARLRICLARRGVSVDGSPVRGAVRSTRMPSQSPWRRPSVASLSASTGVAFTSRVTAFGVERGDRRCRNRLLRLTRESSASATPGEPWVWCRSTCRPWAWYRSACRCPNSSLRPSSARRGRVARQQSAVGGDGRQ